MGPRKSIALNNVYRVVGMYTRKIDHFSKDNDCHDMFRIIVKICFVTTANKFELSRPTIVAKILGMNCRFFILFHA